MLKIWNAYHRYCQNQLYNGVSFVGLLFVTYSDLPVTLLIDNIFRYKEKIILYSELYLWCIGCYTGLPVGVINLGWVQDWVKSVQRQLNWYFQLLI